MQKKDASNKPQTVTFQVPQIPLPADWNLKEKLPGNSFKTSFKLDPGIETQGTLNNDNALDYYYFDVKDASDIILNVTNVPKSLYWALYDSKYNEVASSYRKGTTKGSSQISLTDAGRYYIKVWADYSQVTNFPYAIRLSILPDFD